jgi:hypothetical protein
MKWARSLPLGLVIIALLLSGCVQQQQVTKGERFPLMYAETPKSILILPPMNESTSAEAKPYYATTIQEILSYWGYYVFPYEVTADILKMEGIYDSELLKDVPLANFREYFGADAALFTTIKKWDLSYVVLAASLTVSIDAELKSTQTDQTLWKYNGTVVVDLSGGSSGGNPIGMLVAKVIVSALNSAMADYVPYARQANVRAFSSLPFGQYHPHYLTDQSMVIGYRRAGP